ncbi:hypothetical protein DFQ07_1197 [Tenacibaculum caenipelagi]|uniref:Uncharacterized protein n=1 Tax=Tenacibaculum caenipelagi TaxID=1325435 RepID=A0A4R6TF14_9FLAO|nr:hypothetical protein DFQ07_1197 [Tenacibaculum caenipelagi]
MTVNFMRKEILYVNIDPSSENKKTKKQDTYTA